MRFFLYRLFTWMVLVFGAIGAPAVLLFKKRYRTGFAQRLSFYPAAAISAAQGGRSIWLHAASVGEALAAAPLSRELKARWPERRLIISTFTETGQRVARKTATADAFIYLPLDHAWIVRRALRAFTPSLFILLETEIWPNLLRETSRRGIPILLLSGRLSERSLRRYRLMRGFFAQVLQCISAFGMQTSEDAARIIALGAPRKRVSVCGNLKHAAARDGTRSAAPATDPEALYWVAGSSHRGEEEIVIEVFKQLKENFPRLRLVLAPRHPQRFAEVEALLTATGLRFEKKSSLNGQLEFDKDIMLVDTIGDLVAFYAMGDVAFVGGSLIPGGGHNVLEPARFGKPVLFGPHMSSFCEVAAEMKERGGGIEVQDGADLCRQLAVLLADPDKRRQCGERAFQMASEERGVLSASMALACRYVQ